MEVWRDVIGYEGIYEVSDFGRIRTHKDKTTFIKIRGVRHWKQRILKQKIYSNKRGRRDAKVSLWKDGKEKTWLVARIVGMAWCDGYYDGATINHINGNSLDNSAVNLEWVSLRENINHGFKTGLYANSQKTICLKELGGTYYRFCSMADASRFLGRCSGYVSGCLKRNRLLRSTDNRLFEAVP